MLWVIIYSVVAYAACLMLLGLMVCGCHALRQKNENARFAASRTTLVYGISVITALILLPLTPYALVELATTRLLPRLRPAISEAVRVIDGGNEVRDIKVLSVSTDHARIYVVTPCFIDYPVPRRGWSATLLTLRRRGDSWYFEGDYETVWSDCGSADGNVFPPYASKGDLK